MRSPTFSLLFMIPAVSSIAMLWHSWNDGPFRRPALLALWCAAALFFQYRAALYSPVWLVALVAQVVLALYMAVRLKMEAQLR